MSRSAKVTSQNNWIYCTSYVCLSGKKKTFTAFTFFIFCCIDFFHSDDNSTNLVYSWTCGSVVVFLFNGVKIIKTKQNKKDMLTCWLNLIMQVLLTFWNINDWGICIDPSFIISFIIIVHLTNIINRELAGLFLWRTCYCPVFLLSQRQTY